MRIGEIAARAGLATSAIRYYEKAGLLKPPSRASGRRVYSDDVLYQLVVIRFAQQTGFTLKEIRLLLHGFTEKTAASVRWRKLAGRKIPELDAAARRALAMKKTLEGILGCECQKLEQCARGLARHLESGKIGAKCC
jgi:MerR family transcriptional regulator, redox-sensitive transcriptional activator SoxR